MLDCGPPHALPHSHLLQNLIVAVPVLQHNVGVDAAHPKGARASGQAGARAARVRQRGRLPGHGRGARAPPVLQRRAHMRIELAKVEHRGRRPLMQRAQRAQRAGEARGALGVAVRGLAREQGDCFAITGPQGAADGGNLQGVAQEGARAVQAQRAQPAGVKRGVLQRGAQHLGLGGAGGRRQRGPGSRLVDGPAGEHCLHGRHVRFPPGQRQVKGCLRGQTDDGKALAAAVTIRGGVQALAAADGGQRPQLADGRGRRAVEHGVDPGGQGRGGRPRRQAVARQRDGHERGGARGVQGRAGAAQAVHKARAPGQEGGPRARDQVRADARRLARDGRVLVIHAAHEEAHALPGLAERAQTRQRLCRQLQQQAVLRIERRGLVLGKAERRRIKVEQGVEVGPESGVGLDASGNG